MSFTNPIPKPGPAPTLGDWIKSPLIGYHNVDGVTFGTYMPVMPAPLPPYGGPHPTPQVNQNVSPVGQNLFALYSNPTGQYFQNLTGQRGG